MPIKSIHSTKVPKHMSKIYDDITSITGQFCHNNLDEEYRELVQYATAALARKRPSPLEKGNINIWACAITYTIGVVNFLFNDSTKPFMSAEELVQKFQVNQSTARNKSRQIREILKMHQLDHKWILPSQVENIPGIWLIMLDGFHMDARELPREIQQIAYQKGLIPYIHADRCLKTR